mmetsp:Transcript_150183/g.265042  ORF Transcript_150183/g.265042 Transcript_150183/m.265042 type:complete len:103 (-) Transcript_150183:245-553(-)
MSFQGKVASDASSEGEVASQTSFSDMQILKFAAKDVDSYFESKLQVKPGASEDDIFKSMCHMSVANLELLHGEAADISQAGLDWSAQLQGSVWEVRIDNFIA